MSSNNTPGHNPFPQHNHYTNEQMISLVFGDKVGFAVEGQRFTGKLGI